jgi:hypothetical protein
MCIINDFSTMKMTEVSAIAFLGFTPGTSLGHTLALQGCIHFYKGQP